MQEDIIMQEQVTVQETVTQEAVQEPDTRALEQELERLRAQERRRQLTDEAREALEARGLEAGFAPFVLGETGEETRQRVEQLERCLDQALRRRLAAALPTGEPQDFLAARPQRRTRGIRRV